MRLLTSVFLLCVFLFIPISANTSAPEPHKSTQEFLSFETITTKLKQNKLNAPITIPLNDSAYWKALAEILAYQLLSLAFVVSIFYLHTN